MLKTIYSRDGKCNRERTQSWWKTNVCSIVGVCNSINAMYKQQNYYYVHLWVSNCTGEEVLNTTQRQIPVKSTCHDCEESKTPFFLHISEEHNANIIKNIEIFGNHSTLMEQNQFCRHLQTKDKHISIFRLSTDSFLA